MVGANKLLYVHAHNTNLKFLVDSGAQISLVSPTPHERRFEQETTNLQAANGSQIATFGTRTITVQFGNKPLRWRFTIADVKHPLLGADISHTTD